LPDTSLTGQHLKADTFIRTAPNVEIRNLAIRSEFSRGAKQVQSNTASGQAAPDNVAEFLSSVTPPVPKVVPPRAVPTLRQLQLWEGTVIECQNGSFVARATDRTKPSNPAELVAFELEEISPEDRKLVQPGASFYWTIGVERSPAGQITNIERLNFRRLPGWSTSSVREAEKEAKEIAELLFSE
jgi:hypothetical protein